MLKQAFWLFLLLFTITGVFAAEVEVHVDISPSETSYRYTLSFSEDENFNSFSFEKPSDAIVFFSKDELGEGVRYTSAGDFFIIRPKDGTEGKFFDIRFVSKQSSQEIAEKSSFSHYVNFNIPISSLRYRLKLDEQTGEVVEMFPRSFQITDDGSLEWVLDEINEDTLFLLNFEGVETAEPGLLDFPWYVYVILGLVVALVIFVVLYFTRRKKQTTKEVVKVVEKESTKDSSVLEKKEEEPKEVKQESFDDITEKYLTDNEKEVVEIVKENDGISQYDILNFAPHMSKSNLSKIISKLHAKKFLNRIRVGKVNKIYLGERLEEKK